MQIIGEKKGYLIHKSSGNSYSVCRILNEYENREEAMEDLVKILASNMTDRELLKEYAQKQLKER